MANPEGLAEPAIAFLDVRNPGTSRKAGLLGWCSVVGLLLMVQGQRGLWDPDEGRYVEAAREMMETGDWLVPRLNGHPHLTKPPLEYWAIAGGMSVFGQNEFGARIHLSLAAAGTILLTAAIAKRLGGPLAGRRAALIQSTLLLPHAAAHIVTPDTLLVLFTTAGIAARLFELGKPSGLERDLLFVGSCAAFGLAFATKGPPALLPATGLILHALLCRRIVAAGRTRIAARLAGIATFAVVGFGWFVWVVTRDASRLRYFFGDEVLGRLLTGQHRRHSEWYGMFVVYVPAVVGGCLPWLGALIGACAWLRRAGRQDSTRLLLLLLTAFPLLAFALASSRLHFYVLPIFPPIAVAIALALEERVPRFTPGPRLLLGWGVVLLAARVIVCAGAWGQDARAAWRSLPRPETARVYQLYSEAGFSWGLDFYSGGRLERCLWEPGQGVESSVPGFDSVARDALRTGERTLVVISARDRDVATKRLRDLGTPLDMRELTSRDWVIVLPPEAR